jgi:hypothetical protein
MMSCLAILVALSTAKPSVCELWDSQYSSESKRSPTDIVNGVKVSPVTRTPDTAS